MTATELMANKIDISGFADGIYFVSVTLKDGSVVTKKIVKN
jgi:hypothetical protein